MTLRSRITAFVQPGEQRGYLAECQEIAVVTQGDTLDEVIKNLSEAVALHLEGEDPVELGLMERPSLVVMYELQPKYA